MKNLNGLEKVVCIGIGAVIINELAHAVVHYLDYNILLHYKAYKHAVYNGAVSLKDMAEPDKKSN